MRTFEPTGSPRIAPGDVRRRSRRVPPGACPATTDLVCSVVARAAGYCAAQEPARPGDGLRAIEFGGALPLHPASWPSTTTRRSVRFIRLLWAARTGCTWAAIRAVMAGEAPRTERGQPAILHRLLGLADFVHRRTAVSRVAIAFIILEPFPASLPQGVEADPVLVQESVAGLDQAVVVGISGSLERSDDRQPRGQRSTAGRNTIEDEGDIAHLAALRS
jgi:hypothetical protein